MALCRNQDHVHGPGSRAGGQTKLFLILYIVQLLKYVCSDRGDLCMYCSYGQIDLDKLKKYIQMPRPSLFAQDVQNATRTKRPSFART
jgi:hypothetical protein